MCVCLFSALSRRAGALQMSLIIVIYTPRLLLIICGTCDVLGFVPAGNVSSSSTHQICY